MHQSVTSFCLNPKSLSLGELYGAYNPVSNDWKDGVASKLVREAMTDDSNSMKWLVFDGPVDAVWVENLNTVRSHAKCPTASTVLNGKATCFVILHAVVCCHSVGSALGVMSLASIKALI